MHGRRIYPEPLAEFSSHQCEPGDFYRDAHGDWRGKTPNELCVFLKLHRVVEHEDGTITVSPSILASNGTGNKQWHGYLERGVWREC